VIPLRMTVLGWTGDSSRRVTSKEF